MSPQHANNPLATQYWSAQYQSSPVKPLRLNHETASHFGVLHPVARALSRLSEEPSFATTDDDNEITTFQHYMLIIYFIYSFTFIYTFNILLGL
jgi:hypothetical protein